MAEAGSENQYDELTMYCKMLGHEVPFAYCRKPGSETYCRKMPDCWQDKIDVEAFISDHYSEEQIQASAAPPKPKMASLLDLIKQAQDRNAE